MIHRSQNTNDSNANDFKRKPLKDITPSSKKEFAKENTKELSNDLLNDLMFNQDQINQEQLMSGIESKSMRLYLKSVLGYKIFMLDTNILCFKSIYAFAHDDVFCVEIKQDKLCLLKTPFLNQWNHLAEKYLKNGNSISAFLAAVTLELHNRNTFE
ncbi:hypothetical protein NUSPORA_01917 [Nucleospora cyclopteri]